MTMQGKLWMIQPAFKMGRIVTALTIKLSNQTTTNKKAIRMMLKNQLLSLTKQQQQALVMPFNDLLGWMKT